MRVARRNEEESHMPCAEHRANARLTVLHALHRRVGSSRNQKRVVCQALLVHAGIIVLRYPALC